MTGARRGRLGAFLGGRFQDLAPRVATGVVLGGLTLGAVWLGGLWTAGLFAIAAGVMAWELRQVTGAGQGVRGLVTIGAAAASVIVTELSLLRWGALVLAGAAAWPLLADGRARYWTAGGLIWTGLAMGCVVGLRGDPLYGFEAVLWLFLVVVASDIGGYFGGRLIGGPKLWPRLSPKKTWAGSLTGMALAALVGGLFSRWTTGTHALEVVSVSALVALVAQAGDMLESVMKRRFGVKDSSSLVPGHGGLLDRLDALTAAALASGLITFARGKSVFIW
ncbi:MAG TPA: phosphatidate cytidylyltransferase [Paracoccaceae bacterium]|nr:phosphatidate cytidylyltransferase [Paracoccaceae bacterium]